MNGIALSNFENIRDGSEKNILNASNFEIRDFFVPFPASSSCLRPSTIRKIKINVPRFSIFHFSNATVHGFRIMNIGDRYFHDLSLTSDSPLLFGKNYNNNTLEGVQLSSWPNIKSKSGRLSEKIICGSIFIGSSEPSNFGSWIYRFLPKLLLSREHAHGRPIFTYARSDWMRSIIKLAIPGAEILTHYTEHSYCMRDVFVPSLPAPNAFLRPEIQDMFSDLLANLPRGSETLPKIYLSRRGQAAKRPGFRVLENEDELVEKLSALGFVEFIPELHSIEKQIDIISRAKIIVCPGGSGLFGCLFARSADMIFDVEANDGWHYAHANVLAASGRPFTMATGCQTYDSKSSQSQAHSHWRLDVDTFLDGVRKLGCA